MGIDGKSIANRLEVNGEEQGITATGGLCRGEFVDACCAPPAEEFVGVCFTPSTENLQLRKAAVNRNPLHPSLPNASIGSPMALNSGCD